METRLKVTTCLQRNASRSVVTFNQVIHMHKHSEMGAFCNNILDTIVAGY